MSNEHRLDEKENKRSQPPKILTAEGWKRRKEEERLKEKESSKMEKADETRRRVS